MPQSIDNVILHLVFSTKNRAVVLNPAIRSALHPYLATVVRNAGCGCPRVGGIADHVHLAIRFSRTTTIAGMVEENELPRRKQRGITKNFDYELRKRRGNKPVGAVKSPRSMTISGYDQTTVGF
jgi:REP element-mobilizing transposase RayT